MTKQTLGQRIAEKRRGMTQEALAERLNLTPQTISKWENDASCPDVMLLPQLARRSANSKKWPAGHFFDTLSSA